MALSDSRRLCAVTYGLLKGPAFLRKVVPAWSLGALHTDCALGRTHSPTQLSDYDGTLLEN